MTQPMDLLTALQTLGPLVGQPDIDDQRNQAAGLVMEALREAGRREGLRDEGLEESVQIVLLRLVQSGPRGPLDSHHPGQRVARAYLRRAVVNQIKDQHRASARWSALAQEGEEDVRPEERVPVGFLVESHRPQEAVVEAWSNIEALQALAQRAASKILRPSARESFLASIAQRLQIIHGQLETEDLIRAETRPGEARSTVQGRILRRHGRARQRLEGQLDEEAHEGLMNPEDVEVLRSMVEDLRLKRGEDVRSSSGAPSSDQSDTSDSDGRTS